MGIKVVKSFQPTMVYMGSIEYGKDILDTLETFCLENEIRMAGINLIGALSEVTLAYYDQKNRCFKKQTFQGDLEIASGSGNISMKENVPAGHIHLTLSGSDFTCTGGHMIKGTSKVFACEFALHVLEGSEPLFRGENDDKTGLPLWIY